MNPRRLAVESLESRQMLAGNVNASIVNGELRIIGDNASNWIEVRQIPGADGTGRTFIIDGKPYNGDYNNAGNPVEGTSETRINGRVQGVALFTPLDTVRIIMSGGNDAVFLGTGAATATAAALFIDTGSGRDHIDARRITMNGASDPLSVRTGLDSEVQNETVRLSQVIVTSQSLTVATGGGDDRVFARNVRVSGSTSVNLGNGSDVFNGLGGLNFNTLSVNAGASNHHDVVTIGGMRAVTLNVFLGAGNDFINLRENIRVTNRGTFNGGDGFDTLSAGQNVVVNEVVKISIEHTTL